MRCERIPAIQAGQGEAAKLLPTLLGMGFKLPERAVLISGSSSFDSNPASEAVLSHVHAGFRDILRLRCRGGEPSPDLIDEFAQEIRAFSADGDGLDQSSCVVIAIGGGTVMDSAKAAAAVACMEKSAVCYLEGLGDTAPSGERLPLICVPTSSGTGSEATKNSVLSLSGPGGFKRSMRHSNYIPDAVIIDSDFLIGMPQSLSLYSGLDAVCQLLEAAVSSKADELSDLYAFSGLRLAASSFFRICDGEDGHQLRLRMALAACYSGIALANAGLGAVHGAASALGALRPVAHGKICGTLLEPCTRAIVGLCEDNTALLRYAAAGSILRGEHYSRDEAFAAFQGEEKQSAAVGSLMKMLSEWKKRYGIGDLFSLGFSIDELDLAAQKSGMKNSPVDLSKEEQYRFFQKIFRVI